MLNLKRSLALVGEIAALAYSLNLAYAQINVSEEFLVRLEHSKMSFILSIGDKKYVRVSASEAGMHCSTSYNLEETVETIDGYKYKQTRLKIKQPLILRISQDDNPRGPVERLEDRKLEGKVNEYVIETLKDEGTIQERVINLSEFGPEKILDVQKNLRDV